MNWVDAIGYSATAFTILAYAAKQLVALRVTAILSSLAFLSYGVLTHSSPITLMEAILLPVNVFRLVELLRQDSQTTVR
jgi:CHASE2 domain-containing sensor protein